jgi:hypothetical protein
LLLQKYLDRVLTQPAGATHASHVGVTFSERHDRDLRRAIVTG